MQPLQRPLIHRIEAIAGRRLHLASRAAQKSVSVALGRSVSTGLGQRDFSLPMVHTRSAAADQTTPDDLISFLKAIPDGR